MTSTASKTKPFGTLKGNKGGLTVARREYNSYMYLIKSGEVLSWISDQVGRSFDGVDLHKAIESGEVLCELANVLKPGCISSYHKGKEQPFFWIENVDKFMKVVKTWGFSDSELPAAPSVVEAKSMIQLVNLLEKISELPKEQFNHKGNTIKARRGRRGRTASALPSFEVEDLDKAAATLEATEKATGTRVKLMDMFAPIPRPAVAGQAAPAEGGVAATPGSPKPLEPEVIESEFVLVENDEYDDAGFEEEGTYVVVTTSSGAIQILPPWMAQRNEDREKLRKMKRH